MTLPSKKVSIAASAAALLILAGAQFDVAPWLLRRWGFSVRIDRRRPPAAFTNNLGLPLSAEDAALELAPGRFTLGDLNRLLQRPDSDPSTRAFYDAFMANPVLRTQWELFRKNKNGLALQQGLLHAPEFGGLYTRMYQNDAFQYRMAMLARERTAAAAKPSGVSGTGSLGMVRGGKELAKESPRAVYRDGAQAASTASGGRSSGPDYSASQGAEPQPGLSAIALGEMGVSVAPQALTAGAPNPAPTASDPSISSLSQGITPSQSSSSPASNANNNTSNDSWNWFDNLFSFGGNDHSNHGHGHGHGRD